MRSFDKTLIVGVDEVGRGPLAGPVVAGAVILDPSRPIEGLTDSKKLSAKRRIALAKEIKEKSLVWCLGRAEVAEIDTINIFHASLLAMKRAVQGLSIQPTHALIDGKFCPELSCTSKAIIKGDLTEPAISAASIIAKVARDAEMCAMDLQYPGYEFSLHKGYPTKLHIEQLQLHGVSPIHRVSYAPVKRILELG